MPSKPLGDVGAAWETVRSPASRAAAVFVHGWGGDYLETWTRKPRFRAPLKSLIDHLAEDAALPWLFYSVRHTGAAFESTTIDHIAGIVQTVLDTYVYKVADVVVLVAHSLGGLACRQLILNEIDRLPRAEMKIAGLLMYGTPNDGASMAKLAGGLLGSASGEQMRTYSDELRRLNSEWLERVANGGNPARGFDQRAPLLCWNVVGTSDRVVTPSSAAHMALMGDVKMVAKGHLDMVKPASVDDVSVGIARDFLAEAEKRVASRPRDYACDKLAALTRAAAAREPWVLTEEETIELTQLDGDRSRFSEAASLFRSHITTVRTGVACGATLQIGARLDTANYEPGVTVAFDCAIGDGVVSSAVSDVLRSGDIDEEELKDLVRVDRVEATNGTRSLPFAAEPITRTDGCYLLPFRCENWPESLERVDRLEVEISSVIDLAMGWYTFYAPNTVTDRLTVTFRSPFRIACLLHEPLRSQAQPKENDFVSGSYVTRVRIDGPVAAGARIMFIFRRDDGGE
ncbi:MAG: alpha/beta hydrolase [Acidobacteria bacterium]|nr:alpha/beta hydrolase [Acidobacteriota bacterium]MBV9477032.1 alpha/beta hydrolase [Acidobacteriota bacterium]